MNVTPRMRNMKIATVFLATLALIVACFFSLYALDKVKRQYDSELIISTSIKSKA
jgi:hypothetical protein